MKQSLRCFGLSKSKITRCDRMLGDDRQEGGFLTCAIHKDQEGNAQKYAGDPYDDKEVVQHHLQELGLIHSPQPHTDTLPYSEPSTDADADADADELEHAAQTPRDTGEENAPEEPADGYVPANNSLEYLRPARFLSGKRLDQKVWNDFGGELTEDYFSHPKDPARMQLEYGEGFKAAALGAIAVKAQEIGFVIAPIAALISAAALMLYYAILGFGYQPVVVDKNNIATAAVGALFLAIAMMILIDRVIKDKDEQRVKLYSNRFDRVRELLEKREYIAENKNNFEESIQVCIKGRKLRENSVSIGTLIRQLERQKELENTIVAPVREYFLRILRSLSSQQSTETLEAGERSAPITAQEVFDAPDMLMDEKITNLKNRMVIYHEAEGNVGILTTAAAAEEEVVKLNTQIYEIEAELTKLMDNKIWFAALMSWKPYAVSALIAVAILALKSGIYYRAANTEGYCDSVVKIGPKCYHLEVKRHGGSAATTKLYEPVFFHGRVGDNILVSRPFLNNNNDQTTKYANTKVSKKKSEETTFGVHLNFPRQLFPLSSVVSIQTYKSDLEYGRLGVDEIPPKPAPVLNLNQENSFTTINASAQASGVSGSGETHVANYLTENEFLNERQNMMHMAVNNEFNSETIIEQSPEPVLVSNFILDGEEMPVPESKSKRHILVPFFLDPIISPHDEEDKMWPVYAVEGKPRIDTPMDAFIAGFYSLTDPDYPIDPKEAEKLASPGNFLLTVRKILQACSDPAKAPGAVFEIEVAGYASYTPFKDAKGEKVHTSEFLNHALAEGRRVAILASVLDFDPEIKPNDGHNARVILVDPENLTDRYEWSRDIIDLFHMLKRADSTQVANYLRKKGPDNLMGLLEKEVFIFDHEEHMHRDLEIWVPSGKEGRDAVREAFQRSAVISISHAQLQNCGG